MATEIENESAPQWSFAGTVSGGSPQDTVDRKLYQAASLSAMIYGDGLEAFQNNNDDIQSGVLWLLHELICEAISARQVEDIAKMEVPA
jgi:hypothetical protein